MNSPNVAIAVVALHRIVVLLVGALFAWLGFRLFVLGVYAPRGDLKAVWERRSLIMRATPGVFFALFGAAIVIAGVVRGFGVRVDAPQPLALVEPIQAKAAVTILRKVARGDLLTHDDRTRADSLGYYLQTFCPSGAGGAGGGGSRYDVDFPVVP